MDAHAACLKIIEKIKSEREFFRAQSNKKIVLETLVLIKYSSVYGKKCLMEELYNLEKKDFLTACKLITNLINASELAYLEYLEKNGSTEKGLIKDLENSLSDFFKKTFQTEVNNFGKKYAQTFGNWRSFDSLITFAGKMNSLFFERATALKFLREFVTNTLNNDFQLKRYECSHNPHLAFINDKAPEVLEKWKNNESLDSSEVISSQKEKMASSLDTVKSQILTGLSNMHLGKKELYPHIYCASGLHSTILEGIIEDLKSLEEARKASSDQKMSKSDLERRRRLLIEKSIFELLTLNDENDLENQLKVLINKLPKDNIFRQTDLETCLKLLKNKEDEILCFTVVESDHPNDFLLMGTEVLGSCQDVNGNETYNKWLLAYALDGKHKLLLIKDKYGKILARAVIRLLLDKGGNPVIFLEHVYVSDNNLLYVPNLIKLALKKAHHLGVPLVKKGVDSSEENLKPFDSDVFAREKPVPFEYVDALWRITKGPYFIRSIFEVVGA